MNWINILAYSIVMAIITIVMVYLDSSALKRIQAKHQTESVTLRLNVIYKILAIGIALIAVGMILGTIYFKKMDFLLEITIVATLVYAVGLLTWKFYTNHKIILDENKIEVTDWLGKTKSLAWEQIEVVTFSSLSGYIILKNSATTLKIHYHMSALSIFGKYLEAKTKWKVKELKLPIRMF